MNDHDWAHIDDGAYEDEGPFTKWHREQMSSRHTQTDDEARRRFKKKAFESLYGGGPEKEFQVHGTITGRMSVTPPPLTFDPSYNPQYDAIVYPDGTYVTREEMMDFTLADRIEALQRKREEEREQKAKVDAFLATLPVEPSMNDEVADGVQGTPLVPVIYFVHQFKGSPKKYQYAALKCEDGLWYTTGPKSPKGYTWHELLLWLLETGAESELPPIVSSYIEDWRVLPDVSDA